MNSKASGIEAIIDSGLLDPKVFVPAGGDVGAADVPLEVAYLENPRNWTRQTSALFDGGYYLSKNPDVQTAGINPLLHYIRHGYFEGRNPSAMVDIRYVMQHLIQEDARLHESEMAVASRAILARHGGLRRLLLHAGCDPSVFFNNDYYRTANGGLDTESEIPLEDYFRRRGRTARREVFLECTPLASFNYYMAKYPDLVAAGVIPLSHLLKYGLREGRRFNVVDTVSAEFMRNSAVLFADERMATLAGMLECTDGKTHLPGPFWPTRYAQHSIPALAHIAEEGCRAVFIGIVLFRNSDSEVRRLQESIEHEVRNTPGYDIEFRYLANDGEIERYRKIIGDRVVASPNSDNIGFGRAHNLLMAECFTRDRLYIGANPDGYFVPGCIKALVDCNDYFEGHALIEASAMPIDHPKWHDPLTLDTQWVSGACFGLSRRIWDKVNGFDEQIHLYCEDVDLSWRVRLSGEMLKVCPAARFMHDVTPRFYRQEDDSTTSDRRTSMLKGAYYLARKWGGKEKAESYRARLAQELEPSQLASLMEPDVELDPAVVGHIADFNHDRFAPSRFWK